MRSRLLLGEAHAPFVREGCGDVFLLLANNPKALSTKEAPAAASATQNHRSLREVVV